MADRLAYDVAAAAETVGVSADLIRRAIRAGDIKTTSPKVNGKAISKPLIPAEELDRWLHNRTA